MDAIGQENTESLQELLENLPLLEQMNQESAGEEIFSAAIVSIEYTQEQICEMTGLRPYLLRFWESEFEEIEPQIREDGQKIYSDADLITIQRVKVLLLEEKLTIERARHLLRKERSRVTPQIAEFEATDQIEKDLVIAPSAPLETQMMEDTLIDIPNNIISVEDKVQPLLPELMLAPEEKEVMTSEEAKNASTENYVETQSQFDNPLIVNLDALEVQTLNHETVLAQEIVANTELETIEKISESSLADLAPISKDKSFTKTAFVTRFQKNEVGPGPAGVQLAQDLALARAQSQMNQPMVVQHVPQIDTLMEKRDDLIQIKNKIQGLIFDIKLKRNFNRGN